jgi:hypothetical protein
MAATFANVSNQLAALKELYTGDDYMKDLVYKKNPFLALVPKDESPTGFAGKYIPVPLIYGANQGRSATFTNAQTNQTPAQLASFFVYRVQNYSLATITNELLEATAGNAGAFLEEGKLQVDMATKSISNDLALDLFRSGTGSRGQISTFAQNSTVSGTIVLNNLPDVNNFEVNMTLIATTTDGGTPSSDTFLVTAVNRSSGILTGVPSAASMSTAWATGGYVAVQGDVNTAGSVSTGQGASTTSFLKMTGLAGWLPINGVSTNDSFWNVNRSVDPVRLAGLTVNGSNESVEEALIDASTQIALQGGEPDMCFMSFNSWQALEKEIGSKVQYVQVQHDTADIAFKGLTVNAPYGPITVMADRSCQSKTAYLLEMSVWKLRTLNKAPHILTYGREGLDGLRVGNADALEVRMAYYGNLICSAPGYNAVVSLSA